MRPGRVLAGRACSRAVHVDMSEYLHGILEVNAEERWARVQPGVVLDELNAHLGPWGLMFAPDVPATNQANVGGGSATTGPAPAPAPRIGRSPRAAPLQNFSQVPIFFLRNFPAFDSRLRRIVIRRLGPYALAKSRGRAA